MNAAEDHRRLRCAQPSASDLVRRPLAKQIADLFSVDNVYIEDFTNKDRGSFDGL